MPIKKEGTSEKLLTEYLELILGMSLDEVTNNYFFNIKTLEDRDSVKKYLKVNMGDRIRKCIPLNNKVKMGKDIEENLEEKDLIVILRYILKGLEFHLLSIQDGRRLFKGTIYTLLSKKEYDKLHQ